MQCIPECFFLFRFSLIPFAYKSGEPFLNIPNPAPGLRYSTVWKEIVALLPVLLPPQPLEEK